MEGGTAHGWRDQLVCLEVPPLPPYIKEQGGGRPAQAWRAKGVGFLLLVGIEILLPIPTRSRKGRRRREGRGEVAPPTPSPTRIL